jgi:photosystem II stability/assembly factor-like uncharacterized protein
VKAPNFGYIDTLFFILKINCNEMGSRLSFVYGESLTLKIKMLKPLIIIFSIGMTVGFANAQWKPTNGPFEGLVTSFVNVGDTLFARIEFHSSIYRSIDHGINWTEITIPDSTYVNVLLVRSNIIFAGMGDGTFRSSDGGNNWQECSPSPINTTQTLTQNSNYIFKGNYQGIYRSSDEGYSWVTLDTLPPNSGGGYSLFANDTFILAATRNGIYRSTNMAHTWTKTAGINNNTSTIDFIKDISDKLYAGSSGAGVAGGAALYYSNDGGKNWILNDTISSMDIIQFDNTLFVAGLLGIYRSIDQGLHWDQINFGINDLNIHCIKEISGNLLIGTISDWVYISKDTGKNWMRVQGGFPSRETYNLSARGNFIFAGSRQTLYRSSDEGNSWISKDIFNTQNEFYDDAYSIAVTDSFLFAVGIVGIGILYRSSDNGENWSLSNEGSWSVGIFDSIIFSYDQLDAIMWRSIDNGRTWKQCTIDTSFFIDISTYASIGDTIFAGGNGMVRSSDAGSHWTYLRNFPRNDVNSLMVIGDTLYAGLYLDGILRSTDLGETWLFVNNGLVNLWITSLASSGKYIFAGTDSGVYASSDAGLHWKDINQSLTNRNIMSLLVDGEYLYAGISNSGVWERPLSDLAVASTENPPDFILDLSVPNPFTSESKISFSCAKPIKMDLKIVDILGKELFSESKTFEAGNNNWLVDGRDLPSGTLYARISTGFGEVKTVKLVHE